MCDHPVRPGLTHCSPTLRSADLGAGDAAARGRARIHPRRFPATAAQGGYRGGIPRKSIAQDMTKRIRKAVFPVAGLGTRFLPATKTVPKEMLPIVDRPLIQYAVDEAIRSEEHTYELQSLMRIPYAGFCMKNKTCHITHSH